MEQTLYLDSIDRLIKDRIKIFNTKISITDRNTLVANWDYYLQNNHRHKIEDIISIFVDIRNSTELSASTHSKTTASIYEFFTGSAIRIFHAMKAEYIDIKWDGVFALYSKDKVYTALAAAVTFKTFADIEFKKRVSKNLQWSVDVGYHMWIDQKTVLVKQLWLKDTEWRDKRKNEVWAWKPINMSAKLASLSKDWELYVSDRFFKHLKGDLVLKSCGCSNWENDPEKVDLWEEIDLSENKKFDFDKGYVLKSNRCKKHWKERCQRIIALDNK